MKTLPVPASAAPLLRPKHQLFIQAFLSGLPQRTAYQTAYPKASLGTAENQAWRLLQRPDVQDELARLRALSENATLLSLRERREYLARVVRTPATEVSPTSNADLIQEIKVTPDGDLIFRLPSKLRALHLDARLAGEIPPAQRPEPAQDLTATATTPGTHTARRPKTQTLSKDQQATALEILHAAMFTHPSPASADACPTECEPQRRILVPQSASPVPPVPRASPSPRSGDVLVPSSATPTPPPSPNNDLPEAPNHHPHKTYAAPFLSQFRRGTPQIDLASLSPAHQKALLGTKWKPQPPPQPPNHNGDTRGDNRSIHSPPATSPEPTPQAEAEPEEKPEPKATPSPINAHCRSSAAPPADHHPRSAPSPSAPPGSH